MKLKIYLDNCCYSRPFDDFSIGKNGLEATAKMFIQSLVKYNSVLLCYSYMSLFEIDEIPFEENKQHIQNFVVNNADIYISKTQNDKIENTADEIMQTGIKQKDVTHLACALLAECDYFITTDKRVLKYKTPKMKIIDPIEFVKAWRA